ncbi:MAG TPA: methylated-DNA--[protein]-cysteine S-methyltransferase [Chlamydiales bacterium]|nr:methylated-DNA--[protein]-cysteine S-methyltransferase [Chlamydiales bacterium]
MIAIADDEVLYRLDFAEHREGAPLPQGRTGPILSIERELKEYFEGKLREFKTPIAWEGTPFQRSVWEALRKIPFGQTISYAQLAATIGKPTAFRAAAQANGANPLTILVPCHRVINANGELGGYSAGLKRKEWLLRHEKKFK